MNDTLTFTLIQSELQWENTRENLQNFEQKIKNIVGKKEVVVLPEMFTTGFSINPSKIAETMDGKTLHWMKKESREHKIILTGSLIIQENNTFFNRQIWMQPNELYGVYDKRHLFSMSGEDKEFSAGKKKFIAQVKGWKICTQICYDLRFPVWNRQQKESPFDVLMYIANWPTKRIYAWKTLLQARAIENQCFVVAVNRIGTDGNGHEYCGESCVINPMGEVILHLGNEENIQTITLNKNEILEAREKFPFGNDADEFIIL